LEVDTPSADEMVIAVGEEVVMTCDEESKPIEVDEVTG
jgi:hypothetical protein